MKQEPLSLEIFAHRFQLPLEDLSYGIAQIANLKKAVILVKNKLVFIDVMRDRITPKEMPNIDISFEDAELSFEEDNFIFKSECNEIKLTKYSVEEFYSIKYYSEATKLYLGL